MTRNNAVEPKYEIGTTSLELGEYKDSTTRYGSGIIALDMPLKSDPNSQLLFDMGGRSKIIDLKTEVVGTETEINTFLNNLEEVFKTQVGEGEGELKGMPYEIQIIKPTDEHAVAIGDFDFSVDNKTLGGSEVIECNFEILVGKPVSLPFGGE